MINPAAEEVCDEVDNDCDGDIDEDVTIRYADNDFDSYGDPNDTVESCTVVDGYVDVAGDCNDGSAAVYPRHWIFVMPPMMTVTAPWMKMSKVTGHW